MRREKTHDDKPRNRQVKTFSLQEGKVEVRSIRRQQRNEDSASPEKRDKKRNFNTMIKIAKEAKQIRSETELFCFVAPSREVKEEGRNRGKTSLFVCNFSRTACFDQILNRTRILQSCDVKTSISLL
jgi:hypothetical protein